MSKNLDWLITNIREDLKKASNREIKDIYNSLKKLLNKYDNDTFIKNIKDFLKKVLKSKREKCSLFFEDIIEGIDSMSDKTKQELKKDLLDLSNIHRTIFEDLAALIGAL